MWLRRLQRPGVYDPYNKYYDPNGSFNIYTGSVRMPNCTAYSYLRAQEAEQLSKRDPYLISVNGGFGNAKTWYATTPLPKGTTLREGSIAVFDGQAGHVAIVEKKISDTHAIISESNYDDDKSLRNWKYWQTRECDLIVGKSTISGIGPFIGCIYLDINDRRVVRDKTKNQISVNYDYLNVRVNPSLSADKYTGCFCPDGIYNVLDIQQADGYTWYKLDDNYWVAGVEEVEFLPKEDDEPEPVIIPQPVERNSSKDQVYVGVDELRIRETPSTKSAIIGHCIEDSYYDVKDNQDNEGYTWYGIGDSAWIAGVEGVDYLPEGSYDRQFGLDLSEWQRGINISQLKSEGMQFAILRAAWTGWGDGVSKHLDDCFEDFYAQCKANNIPVGAYYYSCATTYDQGKSEAKYLVDNCLKDKYFELPIAIDVEDTHNQQPAGKEAITSAIKGFCEYLEAHNYLPIIYASSSWFKNYIGDVKWDRWVAQWSSVKPENCDIWQYSSEEYMAGQRIDSNYMYFDYETYIKTHGLNIYEGDEEVVITPVERDETKNQIYVGDFYLNLRKEPSTSAEKTGQCEPNSYYDVFGVPVENEYTWYYLGYNSWGAGVDGVEYLPAKGTPIPKPVERDESKVQVHILNNVMYAFTEPSLSADTLGQLEPGYYNVYSSCQNEGYTWYDIGGVWVADAVRVLEPWSPEPEPTPDPEPTPEPEPIEWQEPQGVDRDQSKDQIYVGDFYLNMREEPSLDAKKMGAVEKNSYYDVLDKAEDDDYNWYKLGDRAWSAGVDGVDYLPAFTMPQPVDVNESRDQVYIGDVVLKIRFEPSTSSEMMGYVDEFSNYNVFEVVNKSDYTWYKLGDNAYIAQCDDEIQYFPAGSSRKGAELKKLLPQLKNNIDTALVAINANLGNEYYDDLFNKATDLNDFIKDNFDQYAYDLVDDHNYNEVDIIYTTDIHGYWKGYEESSRVQTNFSMDDIKTYENRLLANNIKPLIVNSGDTIHGSERANANYGEDAINAYNNLDFFATVFGNHEFRYNDEGPIFQQQMAKLASATACNIKYKANNEYVFPRYKTAKIGNVTLGVIGVGFPGPDGGHDNLDEYDILTDERCYDEIQKCIDELKDKGIQHILCAVHLGNSPDGRAGGNICVPSIVANTSGLDVVFPGHSHSMQEAHYEVDKSGREVLIAAQPRCDLAYLSILKIKSNGFESFLIESI